MEANPLPSSVTATHFVLNSLSNGPVDYFSNQIHEKVLATASLRDPFSGKLLAEGDGLFYLKKLAPPLPDTSTSQTATEATASPRETFPGIIPYEEARRYFGPKNPNAAENLVAFHRGDAIALQRAKL